MRGKSSLRKSPVEVRGDNFEAVARKGYIFDRVWGTMSISEAEKNADALSQMAGEQDLRRLLIDLDDLEWISNLPLRQRCMELFHKSTTVFDQVALVSCRPAILYLVGNIAASAGLRVQTFGCESDALGWLKI